MNAFEFVKNFEIAEAIDKVSDCEYLQCEYFEWLGVEICVADLKRIVDSHEIVESHKFPEDDETGLDGAHCLLDMYGGYELVGEKLERLKQAIADVEACQ